MWVAFAVLTFFSAKNIRILYIESAKTVNEMTLNEFVKLTRLWTTGPWYLSYFSTKYICCKHSTDNEYPHHMFLWRDKKNIKLLTLLSGTMKQQAAKYSPDYFLCQDGVHRLFVQHRIFLHHHLNINWLWYLSHDPLCCLLHHLNIFYAFSLSYTVHSSNFVCILRINMVYDR